MNTSETNIEEAVRNLADVEQTVVGACNLLGKRLQAVRSGTASDRDLIEAQLQLDRLELAASTADLLTKALRDEFDRTQIARLSRVAAGG